MPLPDDYVEYLRSDVADLHSSPTAGAGSVVAALFLREFLGDQRDRWAHIDMSAPSWAEADRRASWSKGATGWGVRTLLRWLEPALRRAGGQQPGAGRDRAPGSRSSDSRTVLDQFADRHRVGVPGGRVADPAAGQRAVDRQHAAGAQQPQGRRRRRRRTRSASASTKTRS